MELIKIGQVVDDGQGDYLRRGGQKVNKNFTELYDQLGDGDRPFAAGAWKTWASGTLEPKFGESWAVNTTAGQITVNLPKGSATDYNKTIKLRDVWGTWANQSVTLNAASGDTLKGSPLPRQLDKNLMDVELVYCSPGRWEYVENKRVDRITTSDLSTVAKREILIETDGQTDFPDVFGSSDYNVGNVEVYLRGNLLYYGKTLNENSNYGSIDPTNPTKILPLDGRSIRIVGINIVAGDTLTIVTYMDGIASYRSSYNIRNIQMLDASQSVKQSTPGEIWVGDLSTKSELTIEEIGIDANNKINPNSLEVLINGIQMSRAGAGDLPQFKCEGAFAETQDACWAAGGSWIPTSNDYSLVVDDNGNVTQIVFGAKFEHDDMVTFRWFNNDIGSLLDWEGPDGIKERADKIYLNTEQEVTIQNTIEYSDFDNPSQKTMSVVPGVFTGRIETLQQMFDIMYPVGTIYENANNPANPRDYMGIGVWKRYAEGKIVAGWTSNQADVEFSLNNNDLDSSGNPSATAGGTYGSKSVELTPQNIPEIESTDKVLISHQDGNIIVGGCLIDPDAQGPGYTKYIESILKVNKGNLSPVDINILPPLITAYKWVRVG
ncbi:baseplate wedge protein [Aeromonas phage B614]|nr:baseplate wedge protein [Aeromonas phage B614]UYD58362.1 baseplate wedge protein [Aeromonas phage avDM14-QBC]UYD58826.1 baseplate wedge protein [Aeromonas phage avDM10-HWA]UYD58871.1 baseplate wedge protein [Aeromonas phage avDM7-IJDJ]UYD59931.1 baseplate wedge protein [Aeromonas phage avDM9-HANS]